MISKGKLLALLMVFAAAGTLAATGAFTTVQADRAANIQAVGDGSSLIQTQPANSSLAEKTGNQAAINFSNGKAKGTTRDSRR
jgi:hypothetical protein